MECYDMCLMNKNPTWFRGNQKILNDHITTIMHTHIDNITTTAPGLSDQSMVIFNLRTKKNWDNANSMDVELLASFNPFLQQIWHNMDVHETWEILSNGIEDMSSMLAPTKVVLH